MDFRNGGKMDNYLIYEALKDELRIQDEALRKLIWILDKNFNYDDFKQNLLLIGKRGSGKTTMVRKVAEMMEIPMGEVYNMFVPGGFNADLFLNGVLKLLNDSFDGKGILLLHDFQNSFIYGSSNVFNSMIASGVINLGDDKYLDVSNITFVGEMDTNNVTDLFPKDVDFLEEFKNYRFMSPTLNILYENLSDDNIIGTDEDNNLIASLGLEKYVAGKIRESFLSTGCQNAFGEKIYMNDMNLDEILNALKSPLSALNLYRNDLNNEYFSSEGFVRKVACQIMESGEGLHYVRRAASDTISHDFMSNSKILKKESLFRFNKK